MREVAGPRLREEPQARLLLLVCWGRDSAYAELAELCGWDGDVPSGPALTQQWAKLNDVTANLKTTSWTNVGHRFDKGGLTSFTNVVSPIPPIRK